MYGYPSPRHRSPCRPNPPGLEARPARPRREPMHSLAQTRALTFFGPLPCVHPPVSHRGHVLLPCISTRSPHVTVHLSASCIQAASPGMIDHPSSCCAEALESFGNYSARGTRRPKAVIFMTICRQSDLLAPKGLETLPHLEARPAWSTTSALRGVTLRLVMHQAPAGLWSFPSNTRCFNGNPKLLNPFNVQVHAYVRSSLCVKGPRGGSPRIDRYQI